MAKLTISEIVVYLQSKGYLQGGQSMASATKLSDQIFEFFKAMGYGQGMTPHELSVQFVREHPEYEFLEVNSEIWHMTREHRLVETGLQFGCYKIPDREFQS